MTTYFRNLFAYDSTVNRQLLESLRDLSSVDPEARDLFAHLLASKKVWITRLNGADTSGLAIWPELSWSECEDLIEENRDAYESFLTATTGEELKAEVTYRNSKGTVFETPARDILSHVLIHGGYHRGQIAKKVREAGEEPINTDYITHVRNL